ncbi:hypothetical protein HUZ36_08735 [Pseudoalteromonas sp. McH1-7]|uniref:Uncharacterized protein n=1 Tax=Pseudoalteromonas peptidolytica F12-50-A1 TaxID=1315280 RepID=A0A8I0MZL1_9GAMM|nr:MULTISPECIES: hypothetical protein [Pseudoalteromonas]MBE0348845.1 hypothetical protein [Pseudoalteromonas peptidolytica F12-50-A1]MDW7548703.1 hypothetical protein [Pseudoalteromonas peptidolytica]NLR16294.1 hypothetical protein [Pseudoalteromonas peptidolytica]NUZ10863.1 hypothetical protein [Pseudoalteromonas sp. McH1-7]RXF05080.1 hypothetical protein D9603_04650 [Pseudoalteromonas sp. PS5]
MTQRTLKHADWLKIVESRAKQQQQQSKPKTKLSPMVILTFLLAMTISLLSAWALLKDTATPANLVLSEESEKRLNRYFTKQYMVGSWQFSHMKISKDDINVFIRIPSELALTGQALKGYIEQSLCPPATNNIWRDVNQFTLYMHLYSGSPRHSDYAKCSAP